MLDAGWQKVLSEKEAKEAAAAAAARAAREKKEAARKGKAAAAASRTAAAMAAPPPASRPYAASLAAVQAAEAAASAAARPSSSSSSSSSTAGAGCGIVADAAAFPASAAEEVDEATRRAADLVSAAAEADAQREGSFSFEDVAELDVDAAGLVAGFHPAACEVRYDFFHAKSRRLYAEFKRLAAASKDARTSANFALSDELLRRSRAVARQVAVERAKAGREIARERNRKHVSLRVVDLHGQQVPEAIEMVAAYLKNELDVSDLIAVSSMFFFFIFFRFFPFVLSLTPISLSFSLFLPHPKTKIRRTSSTSR